MSRASRFRLISFEPIRLSRGRRRFLYMQFGLLFVTGIWWLGLHFGQAVDAAPSTWLPWSMKFHGGVAILLTFSLGTLLFPHMLGAWHARRNRVNGVWLASTLVVLVISGYGLYYFDGERLRQWTEWAHWIVGLVAPAVLYWHILRGRKTSRHEDGHLLGLPRR